MDLQVLVLVLVLAPEGRRKARATAVSACRGTDGFAVRLTAGSITRPVGHGVAVWRGNETENTGPNGVLGPEPSTRRGSETRAPVSCGLHGSQQRRIFLILIFFACDQLIIESNLDMSRRQGIYPNPGMHGLI